VRRQLHPDASDDPIAAERFKELAAAYAVLSDEARRRDYDANASAADGPSRRITDAPRTHSSRPPGAGAGRRGRWSSVCSSSCSDRRGVGHMAAARPTTPRAGPDSRSPSRPLGSTTRPGNIDFTTRDGQRIVTHEPQQHGDPSGIGSTVGVRYDPADPQHVIVDSSTFGRDITLAIVAIKLLVGGLCSPRLGARRLRKLRVSR
jgi:curved DNA-binding protein CbpA